MFGAALAGMGGLMAPRGSGTIPSDQGQPPRPSGMFGAGAGKPDWMGAIQAALNGFLAARGNPVGMMGLQQMRMARQQAMQEQQRQQQRGEDFEDWVKKQAWQAANPPPVNNDTANDYRFISEKLGPPAANEWLRNQGDPLVTVQLPGNRVYSGPRSQLGSALGAPAPSLKKGHVEDGFELIDEANPGDPKSWRPVNGGPTQPASGMFQPLGLSGETITSTYRDPAHNRRIGGVANSFHTRKGPDGKALARDSVPPRGMSMATYYSQLRRLNPLLDVINEGDHVHMEPRGR